MKYRVILFQPYLRRFFLNFGKNLRNGEFVYPTAPAKSVSGYSNLPNFDKEILRKKTTFIVKLRRFLGMPNIRIKFSKNPNDNLYFTYGCLLITNKPYCVYIENGLALYNYDLRIAKNIIAKLLVSFLATRNNCKKLIFFSEASKKSFYSTINYTKKTKDLLLNKSAVIYPPAIEKKESSPKSYMGSIRLLFPGTFYIKGGIEVINAFEKLKSKYDNITLTIITSVHMLRDEDVARIKNITGVTLLDAKLSEQEMIQIYESHDILLLPTYREGFGLVLVEALAYGMPLIITDQYATTEMISKESPNGFVYFNHPLKDYDSENYSLLGKYYDPKDFYSDLFKFQSLGVMKPIENFIYESIEKFILDHALLEKLSKNSIKLYSEKFHYQLISDKIESVFLEAIEK